MSFTYSISIPHYNSSLLLKRMLKSIPERDDIQVIVVDDGSSEEHVSEIKNIQHQNLEIVFLEENRGGGYARNVGLQHAKGKWFISVDADDYFSDDAFEILDKYKDMDYDYVCYCIQEIDGITLQARAVMNQSDLSVRQYIKYPNKKALSHFKYKNYESWNKMLSMDFIRKNNIHWENCRINIDVMFSLQVGLNGKRFIAIPEQLYNWVCTPNSITQKRRDIKREFDFYLQVIKRNTIYKRLGLGYPFYRPELLYIPFLLKKRGLFDSIIFLIYRCKHINEIHEAQRAYLPLLENIDISRLRKEIL